MAVLVCIELAKNVILVVLKHNVHLVILDLTL